MAIDTWDLRWDAIGRRGTARGQEVPQRDAGKSAVRDTEKGADWMAAGLC